jgi:hypothetical protein
MTDDIFMKPLTPEEYSLRKPVFIEEIKPEYIDSYKSFNDFKPHVHFLETRDTAKRNPLLMEKIKKLSTDIDDLNKNSLNPNVDISKLPILKERLKKIHQEYLDLKGNRYNPFKGGRKSRRMCSSKSKKSKKRRKGSKKTKRRRSKR